MSATGASPANKTLELGFDLGAVRIDPRSGAASGPGGAEKLDPKVMAVLVVLAERAGQVVAREVLISRIWPGVVVGDEVLSRCIYELRRHLVHAAGDEAFKDAIETLPKRGYRLKVEVTPFSPDGSVPPAPGPRSFLIATGFAVAAALLIGLWILVRPGQPTVTPARANSIAVLPFVDMSPGKDQAYLADGFAEEILNRLAQSKNLRVIARTSSFALRDPSLDVADIADRLDVSHVLEGSVRKSGDTVRITAQLIAASDSSHVWSESYDRDVTDLLAVQTDIANAVATALAATLAPSAATAGTSPSLEAYEKFLQAEFFYYRRGVGDIPRAIGYYEASVALDPNFARAWAALAGAYSIMAEQAKPTDPPYREMQGKAALKAVELEPDLAVTHVRLAHYFELVGDIKKAKEHRAIARELDPEHPMVLGESIEKAVSRGDIAQAIEIQRGIVARDPLNGVGRSNLAVLLLADDRFDAALAEFHRVQEIRPADDSDISSEIAHVLILQRRFNEARTEAAKVQEGKARDQVLALLDAATGRTREADEALARLVPAQDHIFDSIRVAEIYAFRGMADEAFATLLDRKQALASEHGASSGYVWYLCHEARLSPFLKVLHEDPRWGGFLVNEGPF